MATVGFALICIALILIILWRMNRMLKITDERNSNVAQSKLNGEAICDIEATDAAHRQEAMKHVFKFFLLGTPVFILITCFLWYHFYSIWMG